MILLLIHFNFLFIFNFIFLYLIKIRVKFSFFIFSLCLILFLNNICWFLLVITSLNFIILIIILFWCIFQINFQLFINFYLIKILLFEMFILTFKQFEFIIFLLNFGNTACKIFILNYLYSVWLIKKLSLLLKIFGSSYFACPLDLLLYGW